MGTHQNRLDAKGRVSVPSAFRTALRAGMGEPVVDADAPVKLILRPSHHFECIEGWPLQGFADLASPVSRFNQFSNEREDMSTSIYADAFPAETDKEGRIVLPTELVEYAHLTSQVAFMGMGDIFQIWEPEACKRRRTEARESARQLQLGQPKLGQPSAPAAA